MGTSSMIATFGNMLWFYFLPIFYSDKFRATAAQIGLVYAAWLAIGALGSAPAGALADAFGRKPIIILSSAISAVSIFIFAFSGEFWLSAFALPVSGLGSAFFMVSNTLVAESVQKNKRGTAFGTFSSLSAIAGAFSPLLGGITITDNGFFRLFAIGGILTLVALAVRVLFVKETLPKNARSSFEMADTGRYISAAKSIFQGKVLLILLIAYSLYNLFADQNSFITPLYATQYLGYGMITTGILFSALLAIVAVSRFFFGKLSDAIGRRKTIILSWIGESAFVYVFVFAISPAMAILGISLWMLFGVMDSPAINAWVAEISDPSSRGLTMGVFYTITFLPTVPALVAAGYLFQVSPRLPFYLNSAVSVVALLLLLLSSTKRSFKLKSSSDEK